MLRQWRAKLIGMGSDGENTMIGRHAGVVTQICAMATHPVVRTWCVPHQGDLVMKMSARAVEGGDWIKTAYKLSVYLRGQANLITTNHAAQVPQEDKNGWLHLGRLLDFLVGKRMAILLIEKGKGEVVSAPVIRGELGNSFSISGTMNPQQAADLALVLRAGSLAAPMEYIEERTIGPSLGAENIEKGFNSVKFGLLAIAVFMIVYYALFGVFSTLALVVNLLLLIAILSVMQATLTLPGIAAIAFTLGMAIDANVLVNERIREELRNGRPAQTAISEGYAHAWATILDSNVTTLIAGIALLVFGSGPIKGFAVVHCLGILTSMFSSVLFSRGVVNLWYGRRRKLERVSVGQVWRPQADKVTPAEQA
jgi:preprotein translocase subunit SecD